MRPRLDESKSIQTCHKSGTFFINLLSLWRESNPQPSDCWWGALTIWTTRTQVESDGIYLGTKLLSCQAGTACCAVIKGLCATVLWAIVTNRVGYALTPWVWWGGGKCPPASPLPTYTLPPLLLSPRFLNPIKHCSSCFKLYRDVYTTYIYLTSHNKKWRNALHK